MTPDLRALVAMGLGVRPREALAAAALRCIRSSPPPSHRVRLAAHAVLHDDSRASVERAAICLTLPECPNAWRPVRLNRHGLLR
jgi:hypothetical protein